VNDLYKDTLITVPRTNIIIESNNNLHFSEALIEAVHLACTDFGWGSIYLLRPKNMDPSNFTYLSFESTQRTKPQLLITAIRMIDESALIMSQNIIETGDVYMDIKTAEYTFKRLCKSSPIINQLYAIQIAETHGNGGLKFSGKGASNRQQDDIAISFFLAAFACSVQVESHNEYEFRLVSPPMYPVFNKNPGFNYKLVF
jgi:hypothetical protein